MIDHPNSLPTEALSRYHRQMLLDEIGLTGQKKLAASRVLIVGAGGLGSPAALYLAAAGVGTLGLVDHDQVELHNLHRQILHHTGSIGEAKVDSAARTLAALNPHIRIRTHPDGVTADNAIGLFQDYDIILDGTDNFQVRYLNNDAAHFTKKPLVHGSIFKFEGQITVFDTASGGPCYRCLFPEPPEPGSVPACGDAGVLGPVCGLIGSLQALEVIKLITSCGPVSRGRLLTCHALTGTTQEFVYRRDPACPLCGDTPTLTKIESPCVGGTPCSIPMNHEGHPLEITVAEAHRLLTEHATTTRLIDVREPHEWALCHASCAEHIPMRQIPERLFELSRNQHLLLMCHHGGRSRRVTQYLRERGYDNATNVDGGIDGWAKEIETDLPCY